jgi:ubiquinone/menaquinone biosynthesis C-methylase UbiE
VPLVDDSDYPAQVASWKQKVPARGWIDDFLGLGLDIDGRTILDCGCGNGKYGALLASRGARVIGIDCEPRCVEESRKNAPGYAEVLQGSLERTPFSDDSFDIALMGYVIHLLPDDIKDQVFHELYRVLKPGAALVVDTSFISQYSRHYDHMIFPKLTATVAEYYPEYAELTAVLTRAGFTSITRNETVQLKPSCKTVEEMLRESERLVESAQGQTAWLSLSRNDREAFHEARRKHLPKMFGSKRVPQVWIGSFVVGRSAKRGGCD